MSQILTMANTPFRIRRSGSGYVVVPVDERRPGPNRNMPPVMPAVIGVIDQDFDDMGDGLDIAAIQREGKIVPAADLACGSREVKLKAGPRQYRPGEFAPDAPTVDYYREVVQPKRRKVDPEARLAKQQEASRKGNASRAATKKKHDRIIRKQIKDGSLTAALKGN